MKKFSIIIMCVAAMTLVSCGGSSYSTSNDAARVSGRNTASALVSLYNSYRSSGTVSLSNPTDLANTLVIATGYTNLRKNKETPDYRTSFAAGMVSAGTSLITANNVEQVINTMNGLTGLNVNAATISNSVGTASAVIQLLQALGTPQGN